MDLSLDKRLLKIFRDLNDNVAPTDSPHFTGIPRVPSPNGENVKQISNTEYATMKINELYDLILASVTTFENRLNKYNDINVDNLVQDIINNVIGRITSSDIRNIEKTTIVVNNCNISIRQQRCLDKIDNVLRYLVVLNDGRIMNVEEYRAKLRTYKTDMLSLYSNMTNAYENYISTFTQKNMFLDAYYNWNEKTEEVSQYCEYTKRKFNEYLISNKMDIDQQQLFNVLVGDGSSFNMEYENGYQIYIDGQYIEFGTVEVEKNNKITFSIDKDKNIKVDAVEFYVNGEEIPSLVKKALTEKGIMQDVVNDAVLYIENEIKDLNLKTIKIQERSSKLSSEVNMEIKDDIVNESQRNIIQLIFNDIQTRHNAIIEEMDVVYLFDNILKEDKDTLNIHKDALVVCYNNMYNMYNKCLLQSTSENFLDFHQCIEVWNNYIGLVRSLYKNIFINMNKDMNKNKINNKKEEVIKYLSDNNDNALILENDKIYINDKSIKCNDFNATNSLNTDNLYLDVCNSELITKKNNELLTLYVNKDTGVDNPYVKNGFVYKDLQSLLNILPSVLVNDVNIILLSECNMNVNINSKYGASLYIITNKNNIYGNIHIKDCDSAIYITDNLERIAKPGNYTLNSDYISPYSLIECENCYGTVVIENCRYVHINKQIIIGKTYSNLVEGYDERYNVKNKNYSIIANNSTVFVSNTAMTHSDNGIMSTNNSNVIVTLSYHDGSFNMNTENGGTIYYYSTYNCFGQIENNQYKLSCFNPENLHNLACISHGYNTSSGKYSIGIVETPESMYKKYRENINRVTFDCTECLSYGYNIDSNEKIVESCVCVGSSYIGEIRNGYWFFGDQFDNIFKNKNVKPVKIIIDINRIDCGIETEYNHIGKARIHFHDYKDAKSMYDENGKSYDDVRVSNWFKTIDVSEYDSSNYGLHRIELDLNDMIDINKELQNYSIKGICVTDEYNNNNGAICKFRMDCKVHVYYNTL